MECNIKLLVSKFNWYEVADLDHAHITNIVRSDIIIRKPNCRVVPFELQSDEYPDCRIFDCFIDRLTSITTLNYAIYSDSAKDINELKYSDMSDSDILDYTYDTIMSFLDCLAYNKFIVVSDKITRNDFLKLKIKNG